MLEWITGNQNYVIAGSGAVVLCTVFGLSIIWWVCHGFKWSRYRWAFTVLNRVENN